MFLHLQKKVMLAAVEKLPQLQIFNMEKIDPQARLDGGDVLHTG